MGIINKITNLLTFVLARPHAFIPRVLEFGVDFISTLPEPGAATTATAGLTSLSGPAFGTFKVHGAGNRRCCC